ncbi:CHAT domain-containing protein [Kitasatospora xanthocidica]|uniref:CHAT domain-containing protein n=1 Tax=Kitasatospora xanthocidica TaxID=83382 RepID=UPI0036E4AA6B
MAGLEPGPPREAVEDLDLAEAAGCAEELTGVLGPGTPDQRRKAAGERLFALLTPGTVGTLWGRVRAGARAEGTGADPVRLSLEIAIEDLRRLPWELLRDGGTWIFHDPKLLVSRRHAPDRAPVEEGSAGAAGSGAAGTGEPEGGELGPLRVLLVVCNPLDRTDLADQERARVSAALGASPGRAHLQVLEGPPHHRLFDEVRTWRPHVLHFIGHGMPAVPGASAALPFNWATRQNAEIDPKTQWSLESEDIAELLDEWRPRLVVLNACRTAADPVDRLGGLAHAFLAAEAEAVVSMQADIDSPAGVAFAGALYREVARGLAVDRAVHTARRELRNTYSQEGYWALPVLATQRDPEAALAIRFVPTERSITTLCENSLYRDLKLFVDRADERRVAWRALDPVGPQEDRPLLVISGHSQVGSRCTGKTWFTRSCLLSCFLHGHRITYVDLDSRPPGEAGGEPGSTHKDWLGLLRAVRDGCLDESQPEPLRPEAFSAFNAELNALVAGVAPVTAGGAGSAVAGPGEALAGPVEDQWQPFDEQVGQADRRRAGIFRAFLDALHAADPDPGRVHVLALDHAEFLLPEMCRQAVCPELIEPIARGREAPLRLLLVATQDWIDRGALPREDSGWWQPVLTLRDFPEQEYLRLADEYCQRAGLDFAETRVRQVFEGYRALVSGQGGVAVDLFREIRKTMALMGGGA